MSLFLCPRLRPMCFPKVTFCFCHIPNEVEFLLNVYSLPLMNQVSKMKQASTLSPAVTGLETGKWKANRVGTC